MYAHIAKGWTVGHTLTRLLLRNLISLPGIAIDAVIAIFYLPDYLSYWNHSIKYSDGIKAGIFQGLFGWIGECIGYAIGAPVGAVLGFALFFPNSILQVAAWLQRRTYSELDKLAHFAGQSSFFDTFVLFDHPQNYMQKAWNIGSVILGTAIIALPFIAAKTLEFFLPFLSNTLSNTCIKAGSTIGGIITCIIAAPLYPAQYILKKLMNGFDLIRNKTFAAIAVLYGKNNQTPYTNDEADCCIPKDAVHSNAFRQKVSKASHSSWSKLIFGPLKNQAEQAANLVNQPEHNLANQQDDPITQEPYGHSGMHILIDNHGHSFNDDANGIHRWLSQNQSCPLDRQPLTEADLKRNYLAEQLAAKGVKNKMQ